MKGFFRGKKVDSKMKARMDSKKLEMLKMLKEADANCHLFSRT